MSYETTRHMRPGDPDFRFRLTLTFVPSRERMFKEISCFVCSKKVVETYDDLAYVSDVGDVSNLSSGHASPFGMPCRGTRTTCQTWYEIKSVQGVFDTSVTRIFFVDTRKKYREVHCHLCKELVCTITSGRVYGLANPYNPLMADTNGFVPTYCGKCEHEYEITTNLA